jgi:hypothetical protein
VIIVGFVWWAVAGTDWLPEAVMATVIVAFLVGIIFLERDRA